MTIYIREGDWKQYHYMFFMHEQYASSHLANRALYPCLLIRPLRLNSATIVLYLQNFLYYFNDFLKFEFGRLFYTPFVYICFQN